MGKEHRYFIYLMASQPYGALYLGVTNDLSRRTGEHRQSLQEGFTAKYGVHRLVWFEEFGDIRDAIVREKQMKTWRRSWKVELIEKFNPTWTDLFASIV